MSLFALGRIGWWLAASAGVVGCGVAFNACKRGEGKSPPSPSIKPVDNYSRSSSQVDAANSVTLHCKSVRLFTQKEFTNPKEHLDVLKEYKTARAAYDAIQITYNRAPTEEEGKALAAVVAKINTLGAQTVYLPNGKLDLDKDNIADALAFLEALERVNPSNCKPGDFTNRTDPDQHQIQCQTKNDWDRNNLGVKWRVYECDREDGEKRKRIITQQNQDLMPEVNPSVTTYVRD